MRRRTWSLAILCAASIASATAAPASACPMCKLANESNHRLPFAYMCSILFMMGMPATLATGFGIGFYRLSRKSMRMQMESFEAAELQANGGSPANPLAGDALAGDFQASDSPPAER